MPWLGAHAMELLHAGVDAIAVTDDPRHGLEGALMFRRFALDHPTLLEVAFDPAVRPRFRAFWPQLNGFATLVGRASV